MMIYVTSNWMAWIFQTFQWHCFPILEYFIPPSIDLPKVVFLTRSIFFTNIVSGPDVVKHELLHIKDWTRLTID
jgi:hypothetical protein